MANKKHTILFITNASAEVGIGHLNRDKIIAKEFLNKGWNVCFLTTNDNIFIHLIDGFDIYMVNGFEKDNSFHIINHLIEKQNINVCFIDLIEREYRALSWLGKYYPNVFLVSLTLFMFPIDIRYERLSFYPCMGEQNLISNNLTLLSGPSYFIFRDEFRDISPKINKDASKVLITMGGTDPCMLGLKTIEALINENIHITIISPRNSKSFDQICKIADRNNTASINVLDFTDNIAKEMSNHDISIINGGTTRYETCLAYTPFIAISIHSMQFEITKQLSDIGVGINLGVYEKITADNIRSCVKSLLENYNLRKTMVSRMEGLFDFNAPQRIYNMITSML